MLADRQLLRYDQKISEIWPEFAQEGKGEITVAELMRHECGLPSFDAPVPLEQAGADAVRKAGLSELIARQKPSWPKKTRRQYHGLTRGWIANEIVVRCDPQRRTIGQFTAQEIMAPLGMERDFVIGLPDAEQHRVAPLSGGTFGAWALLQSLLPARWQLMAVPTFLLFLWPVFVGLGMCIYRLLRCLGCCNEFRPFAPGSSAPMSPVVGDGPPATFNHPRTRAIEIPSANGHASARAMAAVMDVLAGGGERGGVRLLSAEGLAAALGDPVIEPTFGPITTEFTNAGWNIYRKTDGAKMPMNRKGFIGWMGLGGSAMQFHPGTAAHPDVGFGYAMTEMAAMIDPNMRSWRLQAAVLRCAKAGAK